MFTSLQTPQFAMSALLVVALLAYFTVKWYLSSRQIQHIFAHRTQVPAAFSHQISLDEHQNAADYALAKLQMARKELCVDVFLVLFWSLGGGFSLLIKYSLMLSQDPLYFGLILMVLFSLLNGMLNLPLEYLSLFRVERKFGFNKMSKKLWLSDLLTNTVLSLVVGVPLLYAILLFIQQQPDSWWFWAWALFVGLNILMLWLYPTVIAPLFNQFKPLESGKLKIRLNQLLKRCGFKSSGMFVMDGSRRSAHGNAYFTGFGANKRIVFFDTLLTQLNDVQIEAVLAHELGHFHHKHILKRLALVLPVSLLVFMLLGFLSKQAWFYLGLVGSDEPDLLALLLVRPEHFVATCLALFGLILPLFSFFITPLMAQASRRDEFEADAFAVQNSNGQDLIDALVRMYQENARFVETDALYSRFYDSHPPAMIRIAQIQHIMQSTS